MALLMEVFRKTRATLATYWVLARIVVPITILTEILSRMGAIEAIAPAFGPVMHLFGLPPELGLAWLSGLLIGIWGAIPLIYVLVPVAELSVGNITVFSALLLFAHGLPIEQKIIQKAGPALIVTTVLRLLGGVLYAFLLHRLLVATGWLAPPVNPAWIPMNVEPGWGDFLLGLLETMATMLVIFLALSWMLDILKATGLLDLMMRGLAPILRLAGIRGEAGEFTAVGLLVGISYGGGLLIREARSGTISPRQIFLASVFMGFAHGVIEDTLIVVALGADPLGVLAGRLVFAIAATAAISILVGMISERSFAKWAFRQVPGSSRG
ncbi:nucleoside recognition domain-containing protein [Aurantimonas sp. A2-1-M11]|uniref:nucleoside recognition domain-containing protein n=1 Tax=Aurantimonas sp. A2-1-M11 TaxID=3113712 RepID=UPI002F94C494